MRVKIPNALYGSSGAEYSVCYFCKSDEKEAIEDYLKSNTIEGLGRVMSMKDVQKYCKNFQDMKKLSREFTHFVCDGAIQRQLYNFLGPVFGKNNQLPIQIRPKSLRNLAEEVEKVIKSTWVHLAGDNLSFKIGTTRQTAQNVADNIVTGVEFLASKIQRGWANVHSVHVKMESSPAIPLYSRRSNELVSFLKSQVSSLATSSISSHESSLKSAKKGKRAATEEVPVEAPKSAKKVSSSASVVEKEEPKSTKKDKKAAATPIKSVSTIMATEEVPKSTQKAPKSAKKESKVEIVESIAPLVAKKTGARPTMIPKVGGKKK